MGMEKSLPELPSAELVTLVLDGSGSMSTEDFYDPEVGRVSRGQGVANIFNYILERLTRSSVGDQFFIGVVIFGTRAAIWDAMGYEGRPYYPWALVRKELKARAREGAVDIKSWLSSKDLLIRATYELAEELGLGDTTNIADGFRKAKNICEKFLSDDWEILPPPQKRNATVIMLTDGIANEEVDKTSVMADELKKLSVKIKRETKTVEKEAVRIVTVGISEETARTEDYKKLLYECATPADPAILAHEVGKGKFIRDLLYRPSGCPEYRLTMILERIDRQEDVEALRLFLWTVSARRAKPILR